MATYTITAGTASFTVDLHETSTSPEGKNESAEAQTRKANVLPEAHERLWSVPLCCIVAAILNLITGITLSIPSNVILDLAGRNSRVGLFPDRQLSTFQQSVFAALASLGAMFSGPVSGWAADRWGRKCAMMFTGIPCLAGYLILSYAHYSSTATTFVILLFTGRFISGVGMGCISSVVSVYVSEVSSSKLRGLFCTMLEGSVMVGVTLNYALGSIGNNFFYYDIALVAVGIVALFEVLMFWLPDTPRLLLSQGYVKEAEKVLKWLRGPNSDKSAEEFKEIKQRIIDTKHAKKRMWKSMVKKSTLVPFSYLLVVFLVKQLCGINAIAAFAGEIFVNAGVSNPRSTAIYAVGVSNVVGILVSFLTSDRLGRKTLLIVSGILMAIGTTMLGIHFYITRPSLCNEYQSISNNTALASGLEYLSDDGELCNSHFGSLAIVSLIIYNFGFSMGWGPLPWVLVSEFMPLSVRGTAVGVCSVVSYMSSTVVVGFYLEYVNLVSFWLAIWTFSVISLAGSVFVLIFIPETKGKSLEAVERKFDHVTCRSVLCT